MMKFSEVPVGAEFVFEGDRYQKVSPLMAHHAVTGASRLMHRSAAVANVDSEASPKAQQSLPETVATQRVIAALDEFCLEVVRAAKDLDDRAEEMQVRVAKARARFLRSIGMTN